jgi:GNAT superfamily N-acetyltransferase
MPNLSNGDSIVVRGLLPEDLPFIYSTWLLGLYHGNSWFKLIDKTVYFEHYKKIVEALLITSMVQVACLESDRDVIVGYSIHRDNRLHWIFVKKAWRRLGVAKALMPEGINTVTHLTGLGKTLMPKEWVFNPFL